MLSFLPRDDLDEILNLIESVSESFPSYSSLHVDKHQKREIHSLFTGHTLTYCFGKKSNQFELLCLNL